MNEEKILMLIKTDAGASISYDSLSQSLNCYCFDFLKSIPVTNGAPLFMRISTNDCRYFTSTNDYTLPSV